MVNYYKVLQVTDFAEIEVIQASYRALSKKYHPDVNTEADPKIMVEINEAYEVLKDKETKKAYDEQLKSFTAEMADDEDLDYELDFVEHRTSNSIRVLLGLVITLIIALMLSYIAVMIVPEDGSWMYIAYTFYGMIIGSICSKITGSQNVIVIASACCISVVCMVLPYYQYLYDSLHLMYGNMGEFKFFITATKALIDHFFLSGIIRAFFVFTIPFATYSEFEK